MYPKNPTPGAREHVETPQERGMSTARAQELSNRQGELAQAIEDLTTKSKRGGNAQARHDAYCRTYARVERLAKAVASMTGKPVSIPAYDPPPPPGAGRVVTIEPAAFDAGTYRETGGKGPSGKGLPTAAPVPGSGQDGNWMGDAK